MTKLAPSGSSPVQLSVTDRLAGFGTTLIPETTGRGAGGSTPTGPSKLPCRKVAPIQVRFPDIWNQYTLTSPDPSMSTKGSDPVTSSPGLTFHIAASH